MSSNLVDEIAAKAAALPIEKQREALALIESLSAGDPQAGQLRKPFRSVLGLLADREVDVTEEDIAEMRREALQNFPREELI